MEQLHTIQLTKRELGLLEFKLRFLYANIDDDVTSDGQSCTGSYPIEKDHYGKDVIASLYRKSKEIVDKNNYSEKDLQLDRLSKMALEDPSTGGNPKKLTEADMKTMYQHSMSGDLF